MSLWNRFCRALANVTPDTERRMEIRRQTIEARERRKVELQRELHMAYRAGDIRRVKELTAMARETLR